jgi:hypothetical protein
MAKGALLPFVALAHFAVEEQTATAVVVFLVPYTLFLLMTRFLGDSWLAAMVLAILSLSDLVATYFAARDSTAWSGLPHAFQSIFGCMFLAAVGVGRFASTRARPRGVGRWEG